MDKKENIQINVFDYYGECLQDTNPLDKNPNHINDRKPKGFVEIYEILPDGSKKLLGKPNLVVYNGREWVGERIFNTNNSNVTSGPSHFITWFGLGDGGCPAGDPINPTAPSATDTDLNNSILINAIDSSNADYRLSPVEGYYKQPLGTVEFEQDENNSNQWLICKTTTVIGADNGNGYTLSEAGLFTAPTSAGGETGPFTLYARITFPSIVKTSSRILTFIWYVYV